MVDDKDLDALLEECARLAFDDAEEKQPVPAPVSEPKVEPSSPAEIPPEKETVKREIPDWAKAEPEQQQEPDRGKASKKRKEPREKKGHGFFWGMLVYVLLALGLIFFGACYLWGYMTSYEASRPDNYMKKAMETLGEQDWSDALYSNTELSVTEFEDRDQVLRAFFSTTGLGEYSYSKKGGQYQDSTPVYSLRSHGKEVGIIRLVPNGDAGHGFHYWKIGSFSSSMSTEGLQSVSIELLVPVGSKVTLNGKPVSDAYIVQDRVEYEDLNSYEKALADRPYRVRYRVDGLYQDAVVEVEGAGALQPYDLAEGCYYYEVKETPQYELKLRTYSNMSLSVNGLPVPAEEAVTTRWKLFDGLEAFVDAPMLSDYTLSGFYRQPTVKVTDSYGKELSPIVEDSGLLRYTYPISQELKQNQENYILEFLRRYMALATGDYNNRYSYYHAIKGYVLPDTELANYFFKSVSGGGDGGGMLSVETHELSVDRFIPINDICYICEAKLDATEHRYNMDKRYTTTYEIVVIQKDGTWYVAKMPPKEE